MVMLVMMVTMAENDLLAKAGVCRLGLAVMLSLLMVLPTFGFAIGTEGGVFVHVIRVWWPTGATACVAHPTEGVYGRT